MFTVHEASYCKASVHWKTNYMTHYGGNGYEACTAVVCVIKEIIAEYHDGTEAQEIISFEASGRTSTLNELALPPKFEPGKKYTVTLAVKKTFLVNNNPTSTAIKDISATASFIKGK